MEFIARLRKIATDPAARGLADDAAVWQGLVMTHDMIVEGVHYFPDDRPQDVAWKLVAVNLSDLAAKGAKPVGVLMGYCLGDAEWDLAFADGLQMVLDQFDVKLLGGDTVRPVKGAPRALGLTAIGEAPVGGAPQRSGMQVGDQLWVSGQIGDAGLGLALRLGELELDDALEAHSALTFPMPRLALGQALAPHVHAMMDVSDGLLMDAQRMAEASGVALEIALDAVPLSSTFIRARGDGLEGRIAASISGEDFELLFTAPPEVAPQIFAASAQAGVAVCRIGNANQGQGLQLFHEDMPIALPKKLGYQHQ